MTAAACLRAVEMTRKEWSAIDKDCKGRGEAGDLQTMIDCELVRVVLVKGAPATPAPRHYAEPAPIAPVCLPTPVVEVVAQVAQKQPVPAENYRDLCAARQQVAANWSAYDFSAVTPATAKRAKRRFESEFFHLDVACQVASGIPLADHGSYSGRNTKRR